MVQTDSRDSQFDVVVIKLQIKNKYFHFNFCKHKHETYHWHRLLSLQHVSAAYACHHKV
jgi:hypothetical protein